jgi:hypothetical protein
LDFDGSNDYVKAIVNPVSYPFSMAGWANVTTSSVVRAFLVQEAGSQSNSFGGYILNGVFVLQAFNGSANSQTTTNVSILNNWHHIVTIFTSSTSRTVYIDGILRATASDSVPVLVAPTRVLIGCNNESNQFFSGLIDTILLYDRVLTSAEITLLAASRNPFAATGNPTGILILTDTGTTIPALIPTAGAIADQVWDEATAGHTTSGTYGGRVVRSTNSNVEVQITGSNHIAADVHEFQTGVITAAALAADAITAAALAADAVTEIQSGLALETSVQSTLDRLGFTLAALAGNCADPQTAAETYSIILGANTFTIDHTGLDATGTRTTATLTKS